MAGHFTSIYRREEALSNSIYLRKLRYVLLPSCKMLGKERQNCCQLCRVFTWRDLSHWDMLREPLSSSLQRGSLPVTQ